MVSGAAIACMAVSALIAIGLPVGLFLGLRRRLQLQFPPVIVGAVVFVVFALVLEPMLHRVVLRPASDGTIALAHQHPGLYVLYAALAAGVFEETGRLTGFLLMRRAYTRVRTGVAYGIGHGGIEAVLLVGVSMVTSIVLSLMLNARGTLPPALGSTATTLTGTAPGLFLVGGAERISAMAVQLSLSVLVWVAVTHVGRRWLFPLAIGLHALADVPSAIYQTGALGIGLTEGLTALIAAGILAYALVWLRRCLAEERESASLASMAPPSVDSQPPSTTNSGVLT